MTLELSNLLRESKIERVNLSHNKLGFVPADNIDQNLREVLAEQGVNLYREARELKDNLDLMRAQFSPKRWQGIHGRLTKLNEWPFEEVDKYIAYNDLVVWVAGCMRVAEAKNSADVSFYGRNLDEHWQDRLISTAMLWPFILKKLKAIKV